MTRGNPKIQKRRKKLKTSPGKLSEKAKKRNIKVKDAKGFQKKIVEHEKTPEGKEFSSSYRKGIHKGLADIHGALPVKFVKRRKTTQRKK